MITNESNTIKNCDNEAQGFSFVDFLGNNKKKKKGNHKEMPGRIDQIM